MTLGREVSMATILYMATNQNCRTEEIVIIIVSIKQSIITISQNQLIMQRKEII